MNITHNEKEKQFEIIENGKVLAFIRYRRDGSGICVVHTEVDPSLRGQGVGGKLVDRIIEYASQKGFNLSAECSYARGVLEKRGKY